MLNRCEWCLGNDIYIKYHDEEWGLPLYDDAKLFEFLLLEAVQAGLSWLTVLKKREEYRKAFDGFDPKMIVKYDDEKINELLNNKGIIRNRLKIDAFIHNSKIFLENFSEQNSFSKYIWSFVDRRPIINKFEDISDIPAISEEAEEMSKSLKKIGFKFIGPTICYAFMQATGMVNDHLVSCFRYSEV